MMALLLAIAQALGIIPPDQTASWYARGLRYPDAMTAASREHPRGSWLLVGRHGRWVIVQVQDHGPEAWTRRDIDLSRGAADKLGLIQVGTGSVVIIQVTKFEKIIKKILPIQPSVWVK